MTNLNGEGIEQLELPFDEPVSSPDPASSEIPTTHRPIDRHALDTVLDDVHNRFGAGALTSATLLGRDHRQGVPMLPD